MSKTTLLHEALDALDALNAADYQFGADLMDAIEAELAKPDEKPVAWMTHGAHLLPLFHHTKEAAMYWGGGNPVPLYTLINKELL